MTARRSTGDTRAVEDALSATAEVGPGKPLTKAETARFAADVAAMLADPDIGLTERERVRSEGALVALRVVLGSPSDGPGDRKSA